MGGGGDTRSRTEGESSYPAEFKPLAESARKEIEALQKALPLVSHAQFQPAGVAGLSPIEQFTINELVMRTPYLPSTFSSLMELPEPVGAATRGAEGAGRGSKGASGALDYLSAFLGRDVRPAPLTSSPMPVMTRLPMPETAFPGLSKSTLEAARPDIASRPTPMMTPLPAPPAFSPPPPTASSVDPNTAALLASMQAEDAAASQRLAQLGITPPPGVRPSVFLREYLASLGIGGGQAGDPGIGEASSPADSDPGDAGDSI